MCGYVATAIDVQWGARVLHSVPMNFARRHRLLIAWMLYAFILFNEQAVATGR